MRIKICAADLAVGGNQDGAPSVPQGALPVARASALGTIAGAALLTMGSLVSGNAQALTLGGMTVQSNLGEPLRAEVQVFDLTPAESASLTVQPASPTAFRSSGVDYNAALVGMQVTIERRPNGQAVLVVTGNRPVSEPFLDVLLEANWAGGRLSRNYTVLLDPPPAGQRTPPAPPLAPQIAPAPQSAPTPFIAPARPVPAPATAPAPRFETPQPAPRVTRPAPAPRAAAPAANVGSTQLTVRPGDTAGGIANRTKAPTVSLDQMLVAMLQANPDAFMDGNVNRIRAGAVLNVPSASDASGVPAGEAHQTVIAQSRDFNEFRRRLAAGAPSVSNAAPQRQASGSVQTQVQDRRPAATTPDRLTLSKSAANTAAAAEAERIARANQERDSAQRLAELSRNVNELNRLGTAPGSSATTTPAPAPKPVPMPVPTPAPAPAAAPAATVPTAPAAVVAPTAPKPAATAPAAAPAPAESSGSWLGDSPLADPKILGIVGLLVALVVALVSYRTIRRRRGIANDSGFARKGADSFFGGSGGQHVNTVEGGPSTLATSYSPSQLDAGGEVDPIAEADVYLAYGRDLQAEEILKEALRNHPERTALHAKLAEIYAKRRDLAAFRALAEDAHRLTGGHGADWERIQALGEELDPTHPLFSAAGTVAVAGAAAAGIAALAPPPEPEPEPELQDEPVEPTMDDIMLDFDPVPEEAAAPEPEPEPELELPPSLDLDFGAFTPGAPPTAPARAAAPAPAADDEDDFGLDFDMDGFDTPAAAAPAPEPEPLPSLDLSSFSLDLDDVPAPAPTPVARPAPAPTPAPAPALDEELPEVPADDALATKLALADEFNAIGDVDGARHLIEEVISESTGAVRERAERMLSSLQ